MAHVAKIEDGKVSAVFVIDNEDLPNNGEFSEEVELAANEHMKNIGEPGVYKLTSYNNNFRGVYAGVGFTYDEELDIFIKNSDDYYLELIAQQIRESQQELIDSGHTPEEVEEITKYPYPYNG